MGLMQKRDDEDREYIEGIEIIGRSDVPDNLPQNEVELMQGPSAEDIARRAGASESADEAADGEVADEPAAEDASEADDSADEHEVDDDETEDEVEGAAESAPDADASAGDGDTPAPRSRTLLMVAGAIVAVILVAILGYFVGSGGFTQTGGAGGATVTDDQLDRVLARYTCDGAERTMTVRDAIEGQYSLEAAKNDDGTYTVPSAEVVISDVRNELLVADAEQRGIEVSEDEMAEYAEDTLGVSDFETLAEQYQIDEDQAREIVRTNALINKLYEQIVPDESSMTAPTQPTAPADGDENASSADYATYIIGLLGDEWDAETGTWARTDGGMYAAIDGANFDGKTATYAQATAAFYVAYQDYYETASAAQQTWTDYVNGLYAGCNLTLYGVYE